MIPRLLVGLTQLSFIISRLISSREEKAPPVMVEISSSSSSRKKRIHSLCASSRTSLRIVYIYIKGSRLSAYSYMEECRRRRRGLRYVISNLEASCAKIRLYNAPDLCQEEACGDGTCIYTSAAIRVSIIAVWKWFCVFCFIDS